MSDNRTPAAVSPATVTSSAAPTAPSTRSTRTGSRKLTASTASTAGQDAAQLRPHIDVNGATSSPKGHGQARGVTNALQDDWPLPGAIPRIQQRVEPGGEGAASQGFKP